MPQFSLIEPTTEKFEQLALISHNLRVHTKAYDKASTMYVKQKQKVEMVYWQHRMDKWLEENTKKSV